MFRLLVKLALSLAVTFLGFQMFKNPALHNTMLQNAKLALAKIDKPQWIECFQCFQSLLFYMVMLGPLGVIAGNLRVACKFSGLALIIIAFLSEFNQENMLNEKFWALLVVAMGMMAIGRGCKSGKACK